MLKSWRIWTRSWFHVLKQRPQRDILALAEVSGNRIKVHLLCWPWVVLAVLLHNPYGLSLDKNMISWHLGLNSFKSQGSWINLSVFQLSVLSTQYSLIFQEQFERISQSLAEMTSSEVRITVKHLDILQICLYIYIYVNWLWDKC